MTQEHASEIWEPHVGIDYACVMLPGENTETASISVHTDCPDERDRLLNMIAATPGLLAACKQFIPEGVAIGNGNVPDDLIIPLDVTMRELRKLEAAIAQAEGR